MVASVLNGTNSIAADFFICGLMNVSACQFELLKWNLANIEDYYETESLPKSSKEYANHKFQIISVKLRRCIQHSLIIFE